jgi:hypothetical protein
MTDFNQRFADKIPWVMFRNDSGMTIPPFSLVTAAQWYTPDPANPLGGSSLSPFFSGMQPGSGSYYSSQPVVNPYTLYITGREPTGPTSDPGPNGMAARPDVYPQLVSLDSESSSSSQLGGPTAGSWSLSTGSAGFLILGAAQGGLVPVKTLPGPYLGQADQLIASGSFGPVDLWTGAKGSESDGGITFTCYNRFGLLNVGDWCLFDWVDQGWEIVELTTATIVRGQLTDTLAKGKSAPFTTYDLYGNGTPITVNEVLGINDGTYPSGTTLDAFYNVDSQQWEVLQPLQQVIRGTLQNVLNDGGNSTIKATNGRVYTVYEVLGLNGGSIAAGTMIAAFYNNDTSQFEVIAAGCPATSGSGSGSGGGGR